MHPLSAVPHVLCGALPRWGLCGCCIHALGKHTSERSISELTHSLGRRREPKSPAWKNLAGGPAVPLEGDCRPSPDGVLEEGDGVETRHGAWEDRPHPSALGSLPVGEALLSHFRDSQEALAWYVVNIFFLDGLQI